MHRIGLPVLVVLSAMLLPMKNGVAQETCLVTPEMIAGWITNPTMPEDVKKNTAGPCFYQFAWQEFFYLAANNGKRYTFSSWGSSADLFPAEGSPPPFPGSPGPLSAHQLNKHMATADLIDQAAALVPLVDQRGRWVHYSVLTNKTEYDFISSQKLYIADNYNAWNTTGLNHTPVTASGLAENIPTLSTDSIVALAEKLPSLPTGSIELKLAWRVLETCKLPDSPKSCTKDSLNDYITVQADVNPYGPNLSPEGPNLYKEVKNVTLGLVGMHILHKTPNHPDWIWATFEHTDNAPDYNPASKDPEKKTCRSDKGWIFFNEAKGSTNVNEFCTPCLQELPGGTPLCVATPDSFKNADPPLYNPQTCPEQPIPTQVCREQSTTLIPANEQESNQLRKARKAVELLNKRVSNVLQELGDQHTVLQNYQLIGALWLDNNCREDLTCQEKGVLGLANTTMETFEQGLMLSPAIRQGTGCTVCHGINQFNPNPPSSTDDCFSRGTADRSFIFQRIRQGTDISKCSSQ